MSTMTEQVQAADAAADDSRKRLHDAVMALISVVKMLAAKVGDPDAKAAADLAMTEFANAKAADDALQAEVAKVVADNQASGGTVEQ